MSLSHVFLKTFQEEQESIAVAIIKNEWQALNPENRYIVRTLIHYELSQRWIVVFLKPGSGLMKHSKKVIQKKQGTIHSQLLRLSNQLLWFSCTSLLADLNYQYRAQ